MLAYKSAVHDFKDAKLLTTHRLERKYTTLVLLSSLQNTSELTSRGIGSDAGRISIRVKWRW